MSSCEVNRFVCFFILGTLCYVNYLDHFFPNRYDNIIDKKLPSWFYSKCNYSYFVDSYRQVSNIRRTLVGNKIVDHSDVVGASPVGAAPTTSSFST